MTELIEFIAKNLVDHPEDVSVTEVEKEDMVVLELRVNPDDMGKVIGKQGRIAKAMRSILRSVSSREKTKYMLEIV